MLTSGESIKNSQKYYQRNSVSSGREMEMPWSADHLEQDFREPANFSTSQARGEYEFQLGSNRNGYEQGSNRNGYEQGSNRYEYEDSFLPSKLSQSYYRKEYLDTFYHSPVMNPIPNPNNYATPLQSATSNYHSSNVPSSTWSRSSSASTVSGCVSPNGSVRNESFSVYSYPNSGFNRREKSSLSLSSPFSGRNKFQEYSSIDHIDGNLKKDYHIDDRKDYHIFNRIDKPPDQSFIASKRIPLSFDRLKRKESVESLSGKTRVYPRSEFSDHKAKLNNLEINQPDAKMFGYTCFFSITLFITLYTLPPFSYVSLSLRSATGATTSSLSLLFFSITLSYHISLNRKILKTKWKRILKKSWFQSSKNLLYLFLFSYFSSTILSPILFNILWVLERKIPLIGGFFVAWFMGISTLCIWFTTIIYAYRLSSNITKPFFSSTMTPTTAEFDSIINQNDRTAVHTSIFQDFKDGKFGDGMKKSVDVLKSDPHLPNWNEMKKSVDVLKSDRHLPK